MIKPFTNVFRYYKYFAFFIILLIFSSLHYSCKPSQKTFTILYDQAFSEVQKIAQQDDKQFCIVLSRPDCPPCGAFVESLGNRYKHLASKVIFNIVDVSLPENQWYPHWLCTGAFPTTCIFSSEGELQVVVPGSTETCQQCVAQAIEGDAKCAAYFENKQFPAQGKNSISILNTLLSCKQNLENGNDISSDIQSVLEQYPYPYPLFLKCFNEEKQGRREEAVDWANRMLSVENPYYRFVYDALYNEAKAIIDPDYAEEASELSVVDELKLEGCKYKESKRFSLTLTNTGKTPLQIRDIALSCTCLRLLSAKTQTISSGQSAKVDFVFTPDVRGDVLREITFFSDAKNSMQRVGISAVVK